MISSHFPVKMPDKEFQAHQNSGSCVASSNYTTQQIHQRNKTSKV